MARLTALLLFFGLVGLFLYILGLLLKDVAPFLVILRGPVGRAKYSLETWKRELQVLDPGFQASLLRRTKPEAFDLPASDFLALLQEVEKYIREEPALSIYWAKRYQIEQIIRQERIG